MSRTVLARLRKLEVRGAGMPELRTFLQKPGETYADLEARVAAWRAQPGPKADPLVISRRLTVRIIELEPDEDPI